MNRLAHRSTVDPIDETPPAIGVGDLVRTSGNSHPQFQVIAIVDDRAWLREVQHGSDHVVPAAQCRQVRRRGN